MTFSQDLYDALTALIGDDHKNEFLWLRDSQAAAIAFCKRLMRNGSSRQFRLAARGLSPEKKAACLHFIALSEYGDLDFDF